MKKNEWMILALAAIVMSIVLILIVIFVAFLKNDDNSYKKNKKEEKVEVEEIIYEPIEYDVMERIEKTFLEKYNVIEIMDAHNDIEPEIDYIVSRGIEGENLKEEIRYIVESYVEGQTRRVANEVLFEYVEAYNAWEVDHLVKKANNKEKIEILYLYELKCLREEEQNNEQ